MLSQKYTGCTFSSLNSIFVDEVQVMACLSGDWPLRKHLVGKNQCRDFDRWSSLSCNGKDAGYHDSWWIERWVTAHVDVCGGSCH